MPNKANKTEDDGGAESTTSFLLETPLLRRLLFQPCLAPVLRPVGTAVTRLRWLAAPPFRVRLLPAAVAVHHDHAVFGTVLRTLDWNVGELLLAAPLIVAFLLSLHYSVGNDDSVRSVKDSGIVASFGMLYTFLTANKSNSFFSAVFGIPVDRLVPIHRIASVFTLAMTVCHLKVAYDLRSVRPQQQPDGDIVEVQQSLGEFMFQTDRTNSSGSFAVVLLALLVLSSYFKPVLRAWAFQIWYVMHVVFAVTIIVALGLHYGFRTSMFLIVAWVATDWIYRYGLPRYRGNYCAKATLRRIGVPAHGDDAEDHRQQSHEPAVEIRVHPKPFEYMPGQFVKICIPAIGLMEYHSVSISSAPQDGLTVHFRALGDWTNKLEQLSRSTDTTTVWIEGPYGALSFDLGPSIGQKPADAVVPKRDIPPQPSSAFLYRPKVFVLVSGGIGVTPCRSLARYLLHQQKLTGDAYKAIRFVWAVRGLKMFHDLPPVPTNEEADDHAELGERASSDPNVRVDVYCTRMEKAPKKQDGAAIVHAGRPNLDEIIREAQREAIEEYGEHSIAVLGCGPLTLMKDLQTVCRRNGATIFGCGGDSDNKVFIDLHIESFDM